MFRGSFKLTKEKRIEDLGFVLVGSGQTLPTSDEDKALLMFSILKTSIIEQVLQIISRNHL